MKRLGKDSTESTESACSSHKALNTAIKIENEKDVDPTGEPDEQTIDEAELWKNKPVEDIEKSREDEFEEYLADLFL